MYCLQVFGNVWGLTPHDENNRRFAAFTKTDNRRLQVLQNQTLRLRLKARKDESTVSLLARTKSLSVHQLTAFSTIMTVYKTLQYQTPEYFYDKLKRQNVEGGRVTRHSDNLKVEAKLTLTRGGYLYRAAALWNKVPANLKQEAKTLSFKKQLKEWVISNIKWKPP